MLLRDQLPRLLVHIATDDGLGEMEFLLLLQQLRVWATRSPNLGQINGSA